MKIKELAIGNWVETNVGAGRVIKLTETQIFARVQGLEFAVPLDVRPIPITDEILEKNGFKNDVLEIEIDDGAMWNICHNAYGCAELRICEIDTKSGHWFDLHTLTLYNCEFVHQLQNAFTLMGVNKEIIL